jgi:ABC-type polysaccharide/polyol phosphate export permease
MWTGDYKFLIKSLIAKEFRIRYRNMSLGAFWSVLNPLVMMSVITFVFTKIFNSPMRHFPVFVLCGMVPFNFFSAAWAHGTVSLMDNSGLMKRVPVPRAVVPISSVLSNCVHLLIQVAILIVFAVSYGDIPNIYWLWLPVVWLLELIFVCGLALLFSVLNVFVRDTRYIVESATVVLWWLVPIVYPFSIIPERYRDIYQYNPVAALVMAMQVIILQANAPAATLLTKLCAVSIATFAFGWIVFRRLESRIYNYL